MRDFGFRDQLTRSGLSIPSNISEGHERDSLREAIHFLKIAKGSCGELRTQIHIGVDVGYIAQALGQKWIEETRSISNMLGGLIRTKRIFLEQRGNS